MLLILLQGMNLKAVDENEILVTVGDGQCNITTHSTSEISCIPPQSGSGNADFVVCKNCFLCRALHCIICVLQVKFGEKLNYTCADGIDGTGIQIQYQEPVEEDTSSGSVDSTIIIIIALALTVVVLIALFLSTILIFYIRKSYSKSKPTKTVPYTTMDTDINMYTSPAYGTHHVFSEPGLDHLYDRIDDEFMDKIIQSADDNNNWVLKSTDVHDETDNHAMLQDDDGESELSTGYVIKDLGVNDYLDLKCEKDNLLASISPNPTTKQNGDNKNT